MNKRTILNILLLSLFCFPAANAAYDGRWYQVEIIIFAHNDPTALEEEHWSPQPGLPDMSGAVSLVTDTTNTGHPADRITAFEQRPIQMLAGALSRLQGSSRDRVIHAAAWRLPGLSRRLAVPVRIQAGRRYALPTTATPPVQNTHVQSVIQRQAAQTTGDALHEIEGRIKISLSKYLDVDVDLLFHDNVLLPNPDGIPVQGLRAFRLTEFRRMKSNTIHYLDHPMLGVIIGITRL